MKLDRIVLSLLSIALAITAAFYWKKSDALALEVRDLKEKLGELESTVATGNKAAETQLAELKRMRQQTTELMSLRSEVTQLRTGSKAAEGLQAELSQLRSENAQLRASSRTPPPLPIAPDAQPAASGPRVPQDQWAFSGYASPEAALTSAIWSMKEGDIETYFNGLAPAEQERIAQTWKDQPEEQIAVKHQQEAGAIQAFQVMNKQPVSNSEVVMDVQIEVQGKPTLRRIRMNQVGQEWKYGGFVEQQP